MFHQLKTSIDQKKYIVSQNTALEAGNSDHRHDVYDSRNTQQDSNKFERISGHMEQTVRFLQQTFYIIQSRRNKKRASAINQWKDLTIINSIVFYVRSTGVESSIVDQHLTGIGPLVISINLMVDISMTRC